MTDDKFEEWAYGENVWLDYRTLDLDNTDLMKAWNERHGDKLHLMNSRDTVLQHRRMKEIWVEETSTIIE